MHSWGEGTQQRQSKVCAQLLQLGAGVSVHHRERVYFSKQKRHIYVSMHVHECTHMKRGMHTRTHTSIHTHAHNPTCAHTSIHTHMHVHAHTRMRMHSHPCTSMHTCHTPGLSGSASHLACRVCASLHGFMLWMHINRAEPQCAHAVRPPHCMGQKGVVRSELRLQMLTAPMLMHVSSGLLMVAAVVVVMVGWWWYQCMCQVGWKQWW